MSTYTQILYQIIFGTKGREDTLDKVNREELFKYIYGILQNNKCYVYQINGVENHLHILIHLHPTIALSDLVKDVKLATSKFIKEKSLFPRFNGWQDGYGAFTYSYEQKDVLVNYISNQEEHHKRKSFREEYVELLNEQGIKFDEKYPL